jgi:phage FluMu gp28-like protein
MQPKVVIKEPKLANYQQAILNSPARFTITEACTKSGKTFSHIWWLFKEAHLGKLGDNYWWVAPVYGQAEIAFNRMKNKLIGNPLYKINLSKLTITTPRGTIISFKSAENSDNLYGDDVRSAVFDEFTRARETSWFALRTTLTATRGKCKLIGNAKGKKNWGYLLGAKARAGEPEYEYFRITADDAVSAGILEQGEIEQAKRDLPEAVFLELYYAIPSDDGTNPFGYGHIRACLIENYSTQPSICYGVDLAKSVDYSVLLGLDRHGQVSDFDRWQGSWELTKNKLNHKLWLPTAIDSTGVGDPIVEELQQSKGEKLIEAYKFSSASKQQLMEGLAVAIQQQLVKFPDGVLRDELDSFEFIHTRTGVRYSAPEGSHDDAVVALALAYHKYKQVYQKSSSPLPIGFGSIRN